MAPNRASEQAEKAVAAAAAMLFWGFSVKDVRATVQVNGTRRDYGAFLEIPRGEQNVNFFGKGIYGTKH